MKTFQILKNTHAEEKKLNKIFRKIMCLEIHILREVTKTQKDKNYFLLFCFFFIAKNIPMGMFYKFSLSIQMSTDI